MFHLRYLEVETRLHLGQVQTQLEGAKLQTKFHLRIPMKRRKSNNYLGRTKTWTNFCGCFFHRAKKKIVLDLRRTKSTENLQATEKSEATEDLEGGLTKQDMEDLPEKPEKEPEKPTETEEKVEIPEVVKVRLDRYQTSVSK